MTGSSFDEFRRAEFAALHNALPPQNLEAEEAILGGILLDPHGMPRVADLLQGDDFYDTTHQTIYEAAKYLHNQGIQTDLMQMVEALRHKGTLDKIGGLSKLAQLVDHTVSAVNIDQYAKLVKEKSIRRQLIALSYDACSMGFDRLVSLETIRKGLIEQLEKLFPPDEKPTDRVRRESDRIVNQVKGILLNPEYRPHDRKLAMARLSQKTGHNAAFLENLFYLSQLANEDEPLMSIRELRDKYGDQVEKWLMHGLLNAAGISLLHAKGGTGKSLLSYDFIYSLVHGEDWGKGTQHDIGFPVINKHRVMIVQTDESPSDLLEHLEQRGFNLDCENIRIKTRWNFTHLAQLYQEVKEFRPDLILMDSITSLSAGNCVSENDVEYARPILGLRAITSEFGCHILLLHHSSRGAGEARGTTALEAAVSQVLKLEADNTGWASGELQGRLRLLTITKTRSRRPAQYRIELNPENFSWQCLGEVNKEEEPEQLTTKQHILNFLKKSPGIWFTSLEISERTGCTRATVRRCCTELAIDKIIQPRKPGGQRAIVYRVGDAPQVITPQPDHLPITSGDHCPNPDGEGDTAPSDQVITENQNLSTENDAKKSKMGDHLITSSQNPDGVSDTEVITQVITQVIAPPDPVITSPRYIRARVVNLDEEWIEINATVIGDSPGGYLIRPWDSKAAGGHELRILQSQILGDIEP